MSEKKNVLEVENSGDAVIAKAKDFWAKYSKLILIAGTTLIVLVGGFFIYKDFFQNPKEAKAADAMFKAEDYYRQDSVKLALNGDGQYVGFLKIIDKYSGTDAANLARFYAGSCYLKLDDNANAIKHLKKFSTDAKQIQQRAYKLLGDAYADQGNAAEALFLAAYLADRVLKNPKEAIDLYKELKEKFPRTQQGTEAEIYLAQLGVYNVN